jgi:hypothetical protein
MANFGWPQCPICFKHFQQGKISGHSSNCTGEVGEELKGSSFRPLKEYMLDCGKAAFTFNELKTCPLHRDKPVSNPTTHDVPFGPSRNYPRSIAIKPTVGTFSNYRRDSLLHCGITDTTGRVFNFDEKGRRFDLSWEETLCVKLETKMDDNSWNSALTSHLKDEQAMANYSRYHPLDNNCYSFVVRFLNKIKFEGKENHTKASIVDTRIEKPITVLEAFLSISQQLSSRQHVLMDAPLNRQGVSRWRCDFCGKALFAPDHYHCEECKDTDLCTVCYDKQSENQEHEKTHRIVRVEDSAKQSIQSNSSHSTNAIQPSNVTGVTNQK